MTAGTNWGATAQERALALPCDQLLARVTLRAHRAVSVEASPSLVFRWLCQLKLAPYSYDLLDNLGRTSPRELCDGLEELAAGQRFMSIFTLACFEQDRHITLRSRGVAVSYTVLEGDRSTRLLARVLFDLPGAGVGRALLGNVLALGDLAMMRKQLLTLKALAERDSTR